MGLRFLSAFLLLLSIHLTASAAEPDGMVITFGGTKTSVDAHRIKRELSDSIQSISFKSHDQTSHTAHAVPLLAILHAAGVPTEMKKDPKADPKTKNLPLRMIVIVTGSDGYAAAFGLGEMLPDFGNRPVFVALDRDDKPLTDKSLPLELIVPDDVKPGRWVKGIASIDIQLPAGTPSTQP